MFVMLALTFFASLMAYVYGGDPYNDNANNININIGHQAGNLGITGVGRLFCTWCTWRERSLFEPL